MAEASFTSSASQRYRPQLVSEPRIRRNFVSIPKDQQALLDRDDAWAGNFKAGSHGFINVPADVLEGVKAAHARQHAAKAQIASSPPQQSSPPTLPQVSARLPSREEASPRPRSFLPSGTALSQQSGEESDNESAVPVEWSSSPPRQHLLDVEARQPSDKETDTQTTPSKRDSSPPRPVRDQARARFFAQFPSSSAVEDADLEIEEPGALIHQANRVNKDALRAVDMPEPTPPSAQLPVIPCSFNQDSSPEKPHRRPRSRLMKALKFSKTKPLGVSAPDSSRQQANGQEDAKHADVMCSLPEQPPSKESRNKPKSGFSAPAASALHPRKMESSAKIPETSPVRRRRSSSPKIPVATKSSVETVIEESSLQLREMIQSQVLPQVEMVQSSVSEDLPDNSTPWDIYKRTYPDFGGSIGDFVRACLCVQDLQSKKALSVFLYDDFIRAFSKEYLDYIVSVDLEEQPLTAIQWYNEYVEIPVYNKVVVNRRNLETILTIYADEVKSASLPMPPTSDNANPHPEIQLDYTAQDHAAQTESALRPCSPDLSLPSPEVISIVEDADGGDDVSMQEPGAVVDTSVDSISVERREERLPEMAPPTRTRSSTSPQVQVPSYTPTASPTSTVRSKKRRIETPEQRSKRWKAVLLRRKERGLGPSSSRASSQRS